MSQNILRSIQAHKIELKSGVDAQQSGHVGSHVKTDKSPIDYKRHFVAEGDPGALTAGDAGADDLTKI
jgi:hypothetical protein